MCHSQILQAATIVIIILFMMQPCDSTYGSKSGHCGGMSGYYGGMSGPGDLSSYGGKSGYCGENKSGYCGRKSGYCGAMDPVAQSESSVLRYQGNI